jgi:hypothetical protein
MVVDTFATAPLHGQGLFVISEDMAASVFRAGEVVRAVAVSGAPDPTVRLGGYRGYTDRIRSKYRPIGGGGNIGQREGGGWLNSTLDSPLPRQVVDDGEHVR